ncbi:hypothetical protein B4122_0256 [Bacillus subtilis]|uniref:Uncharacterized protein n=1 Tax=Bacillus subtilis TaxID=1423 RepID=A0AAP1EAE7_BACIU|nr:hypothetical protein B4122_0256 [Bacillus subtilis]
MTFVMSRAACITDCAKKACKKIYKLINAYQSIFVMCPK